MSESAAPHDNDALRRALDSAYLEDEAQAVERLLTGLRRTSDERAQTQDTASRLVEAVRAGRRHYGGIDAFMHEYDLSSEEGVLLMCLAEALLRTPDADTADELIKDKVAGGNWKRHMGQSSSWLVNASTWGLMLTGQVVRLGDNAEEALARVMGKLVSRSGEPIIREAMVRAMRIMGRQFVLGRTISEALKNADADRKKGARFSFDMLGEAARTAKDAERYYDSYAGAIKAVADAYPQADGSDIFARPSVSVKLSALHPRYEEAKRARVFGELGPRIEALGQFARSKNVALTVDAEEADRLILSLDLFEKVSGGAALAGWDGFGLAVQAYQKRARGVIDWLDALAQRQGRRIPVRLVKGAYWDTEIKRHQVWGAKGYPVFTRKAATDVSYLACARAMLERPGSFYAQFATHNAHTVAAIDAMAPKDFAFEFQRLHGMGEALYEAALPDGIGRDAPLRVYAPVGSHEDLLAYLVRRLLENGANTSFVNRLADDQAPLDDIIADPADTMAKAEPKAHPRIPLPENLYGERRNAVGPLLTDGTVRRGIISEIEASLEKPAKAAPLIGGVAADGQGAVHHALHDPSDRRRTVGHVVEATPDHVEKALSLAASAAPAWDARGGEARAAILERTADLYERDLARLLGLCVREAGKTLPNALADVREAIDFLRYYAQKARHEFSAPEEMRGPTGERNEISLHGRGVFTCISPWNFPIAIFTGQVAAALAAGNTVIAKPAEQTPLTAAAGIDLMHEAGVPGEVLHFLPGDGATIGAALVADPRVAGVAFTGSTETARVIQRSLAERPGPIGTLIAETGGQNAMIVDSTALPEQVTADVVLSAFDSAGQRCSALRVLFVQSDVADKILTMLTGAMEELRLGDPFDYATDIGPVIDHAALTTLERHWEKMSARAKPLYRVPVPQACAHGTFFPPTAVEIENISVLEREVFGPFLHVVRYKADRIDQVVDAVNATGYGLTLGIHTRIEERARAIAARARVGNAYVNRNQIGAVVGVQPFGGEGLSGTGPKAGGPHYLHRFAVERVVTTDTTASGGNAALMSLSGDS